MAFTHAVANVTNTASAIITGANADYQEVTIQNTDTSLNVFLGGSGVTTSSFGHKLVPGAAIMVRVGPLTNIYAIASASGPAVVALLST